MLRLLCSLFILGSFFSYSQGPWELKKSKNGIKVYVREVPSSKIHEFKAVTLLNADFDEVVDLIKDGDNLKNWNYKTSDSKTIKVISPSERIIWMKNDLPWPVRNRDHVTHMKIERISEDEVKIWLMPDSSGTVPEKEGLVRIVDFNGYWLVKKVLGQVEVTHQLFGDPNGKLPTWLLNTLLTKAPYTSFSNMKAQLSLE